MKVLAIDTSCDETAAAVTEDLNILSNIIWSQASLHAEFGGVFPSLAKREHKKRIDWVVEKAIKKAKFNISELDAIAVTVGPGLAISLEVGIKKAKELAERYRKILIPVNHVEAHLLSPLARPKENKEYKRISYPTLGLVVSGGNTQIIKINNIGEYEILASTIDDALGEALDKAARMLGFGYPGGAVLEKMAKLGKPKSYHIPIPMIGKESEGHFSYSGIKTAMMKLVKENEPLNKEKIYDMATSFQTSAFAHIERFLDIHLKTGDYKELLVGGGVIANTTLRKVIRSVCKKYSVIPLFPYTKKLTGDNAAMIAVTAFLNFTENKNFSNFELSKIDRIPKFPLTTKVSGT